MFIGNRRLFSIVTSKVQRRREAFIRTKYPEYAGNDASNIDQVPRRGKRLGGTFSDPTRPVVKLDGSERFSNVEEREILEEEFTKKVRRSGRNPETLTRLMNEFMERTDELDAATPPISVKREKHIKELTNVDLKALESKPIQMQRKQVRTPSLPGSSFPILREEEDMFAPSLESKSELRISSAHEFYAPNVAKFVEVHGTSVPSVASSSLREYELAKTEAILFDESYRQTLTVSGEDAALVIDHFVTGPVRLLKIGDVIDTCIVDSKGYILTTALVARVGDDKYSIVMAGNERQKIFQYLAQYVVYSRQSGMTVQINPVLCGSIMSLIGPKSSEKLDKALTAISSSSVTLGESGDVLPSIEYLRDIPDMSIVTCAEGIFAIRLSDTKFLISIPVNDPGLLPALATEFGGAYALDMLRMEMGVPRAGIDIPPSSTSPVRASLSHTVDQQKVREKCLFGHERISSELVRGVSHRRVGLVASQYVYSGCRILSAPHRYPIGEITSCAWSPVLKKRVCQAYVKPEYARSGNPLLINLPHSVPETIEYRFKKRITKQGNLQNVFRKLIPATVIQFPIAPS